MSGCIILMNLLARTARDLRRLLSADLGFTLVIALVAAGAGGDRPADAPPAATTCTTCSPCSPSSCSACWLSSGTAVRRWGGWPRWPRPAGGSGRGSAAAPSRSAWTSAATRRSAAGRRRRCGWLAIFLAGWALAAAWFAAGLPAPAAGGRGRDLLPRLPCRARGGLARLDGPGGLLALFLPLALIHDRMRRRARRPGSPAAEAGVRWPWPATSPSRWAWPACSCRRRRRPGLVRVASWPRISPSAGCRPAATCGSSGGRTAPSASARSPGGRG